MELVALYLFPPIIPYRYLTAMITIDKRNSCVMNAFVALFLLIFDLRSLFCFVFCYCPYFVCVCVEERERETVNITNGSNIEDIYF